MLPKAWPLQHATVFCKSLWSVVYGKIKTWLGFTVNFLCRHWIFWLTLEETRSANGLPAIGLTLELQNSKWQEKYKSSHFPFPQHSLCSQHICPAVHNCSKTPRASEWRHQTEPLCILNWKQTAERIAPLGSWQRCHGVCSQLRLEDINMLFQ